MALFLGIPLYYWGIGLLGGGTILALQELTEAELELELGRLDLDDFGDDPDPDPDDFNPVPYVIAAETLRRLVDTQTQARERLDDDDCETCPRCKPYDEGSDVTRSFAAGKVEKPNPAGLGSYYQHFVVPWFHLNATRGANDSLHVSIGEWEWMRGARGSWDGLDFAACTLMEVKLGYFDFLDEARAGDGSIYDRPNPRKPFLGTLLSTFGRQMNIQIALVRAAGLPANLAWIMSDNEVMWQVGYMLRDRAAFDVDYRHQPFSLAPNGTKFVRELYSGDTELFGYWEDVP